MHQSGDVGVVVFKTPFDGLQLRSSDEWFVALNIDNHVGFDARFVQGLKTAVGAALVVGARHNGLTAELLHAIENALVVGCHNGMFKYPVHTFVNPLNDGLAAQEGQRFAWEAR